MGILMGLVGLGTSACPWSQGAVEHQEQLAEKSTVQGVSKIGLSLTMSVILGTIIS